MFTRKAKYTTDEWIKLANIRHSNKYDYSLVEYVNCNTKVKIICKNHSAFMQRAGAHLYGQGCPKCGKQYRGTSVKLIKEVKNKRKYTQTEWIEVAKKKHNNKYDYSLVNYVNGKTMVKIICKIHSVFEQKPSGHLSGNGCPKCGQCYKYTSDEWIEKAKIKHNNKYDYSLVNYVNSWTKVKIICPLLHPVFEQSPHFHLNNGLGCPKCSKKYSPTTEEWIEWAKIKHNNKYDYSLVNYINCLTSVKIICSIHSVFEQLPGSHLSGHGCTKCAPQDTANRTKLKRQEEFIKKSIKKYGDKFDYSLVDYKNNTTTVIIICKKHSSFEQNPHY